MGLHGVGFVDERKEERGLDSWLCVEKRWERLLGAVMTREEMGFLFLASLKEAGERNREIERIEGRRAFGD